jgi:transposase
MVKKTRRRLEGALKAKVALEALRNKAMVAELAPKYQLHRNQIYAWKKQLLDGAAAEFAGGTGREANREAEFWRALRQDWLADGRAGFFITQVRAMKRAERVAMIDRG